MIIDQKCSHSVEDLNATSTRLILSPEYFASKTKRNELFASCASLSVCAYGTQTSSYMYVDR